MLTLDTQRAADIIVVLEAEMNPMRYGTGLGFVAVICAAFSAGCDGGGAAEASSTQFIGLWSYTSGTSNHDCPLAENDTSQLVGSEVTIAEGLDSPLVFIAPAAPHCGWKMTIEGAVASISPGQSCVLSTGGVLYTTIYSSGTFAIDGDTANFSGTATISSYANGAIVNCATTENGALTRVSADVVSVR